MRVVSFEKQHLDILELQEAQKDSLLYMTPEMIEVLERGTSYTVFAGEKAIGCAGLFPIWEGRALLWSLISAGARRWFIPGYKIARRLVEIAPYKRLEIEVACDFAQGHRLAQMLGFDVEAPRLKSYWPNGVDVTLYAKVK